MSEMNACVQMATVAHLQMAMIAISPLTTTPSCGLRIALVEGEGPRSLGGDDEMGEWYGAPVTRPGTDMYGEVKQNWRNSRRQNRCICSLCSAGAS